MKSQSFTVIAATAVGVALSSPVTSANLLTNGDFEAFVGPFTPNGAISTSAATLNVWRSWERFQSVVGADVDPSFPAGWGGNNFAQHSQALTSETTDDGDYTDQLKQGILGSNVLPGVPVTLSLKYVNGGNGARAGTIQVYGIDAGQSWSEFAPWACTGCTLLYSASLPVAANWTPFAASFTPAAAHAVVAVGVTLGGPNAWTATQNGARGVDDVVLSQNRSPICSGATPSIAKLWSPNHAFVPIDILGVTDPDGDPITISIDTIFQDEAVLAPGSGNTSPDGGGIGTSTAQVRAERAGGGNGRVYHIGFTADDGNGGSCTGAVQVSVPKSQGANGAAVDDGALFDSTVP